MLNSGRPACKSIFGTVVGESPGDSVFLLFVQVPYFIEELKITDIDLGINAPQLRRVSKPRIDDRGLWVDLDMAYAGSCMVSMTTKVNLWRLGKGEKYDKEMTEITPTKKETKEKERSV